MRSVRPPSLLSLLVFALVSALPSRAALAHERGPQEAAQAAPAEQGPLLFVEYGGSWWAAKELRRTKDGKTLVHYVGWGSEWDEAVDASRVKRRAKDEKAPLFVESGGSWWPASVVRVERDGRARIHYEGWSKEYDETVDASRMLRLS
jgi:hypothetical protein